MYLLVKGSGDAPTALRAGGHTWKLCRFAEQAALPSYAAVSYAWGDARVEHPNVPGLQISERALRVLDAVARVAKTEALWLDALCVPDDPHEREVTLRQLGRIYAQAAQVWVALTDAATQLFNECESGSVVSMQALGALEREPWVSRFWTYQELACAQQVLFILEGGSPLVLDGNDFLSKVGEPLARAAPGTLVGLRAVENLTDVLASWLNGFGAPFAYQIMAGLAERGAERPADRFNAVLGAIDPSGNFATSSDVEAACQHFMAACEARGDLSFVYANSARSTEPGRSWRPLAGELSPLLAWHTFGTGQGGKVLDSHAVFDSLCLAQQGELGQPARDFIARWLAETGVSLDGVSVPQATLAALLAMGSLTLGDAIELEQGLFFPRLASTIASSSVVLIATGVRWVHGAPALLAELLPSGRYRCLDVGIFVGPMLAGASLELE